MELDCKKRMAAWCGLVFAAIVLVVFMGAMLLSRPSEGGGQLNRGNQASPASAGGH